MRLSFVAIRAAAVAALLFLLFAAGPGHAAEDEVSIKPLGVPGAWLLSQQVPWPANALLVELGDDELVIVDTLHSPKAMDEVLWWTRKRYPKRRLMAINTHFHSDRAGGNETLKERGVPIYASDATVKLMKEKGEEWRKKQARHIESDRQRRAFLKVKPAVPDSTFALEKGLTMSFGGDKVQVSFPGAGHSPDNVVVYFPSKKILFGGSLVVGGERLGDTSDADFEVWTASLKRLAEFRADVVVPGRGRPSTPVLLTRTASVIETRADRPEP